MHLQMNCSVAESEVQEPPITSYWSATSLSTMKDQIQTRAEIWYQYHLKLL